MSLLATVRRLKLHRSCPITWRSQFSHFHPQYTSPHSEPRCLLNFFSQAFHQTPLGLCKHNDKLGRLQNPRGLNLVQFINFEEYIDENHGPIGLDLHGTVNDIRKSKDFASGDDAMAFLDNLGIKPTEDSIFSLVWAFRKEWKLAFLVFKWGEKWDCVIEKTWCLAIWLLGNHKKFSTAWNIVSELNHASKDIHQAMLIMIDRYVAANYVDKAIQTFHMMQNFMFSPDQRTYFTFLNILCKHGNIEEAEEFMFINKKFFPLEIESFNIILNGWCNIVIDISEAKRIWREMSKCCIVPDRTSYTYIISCYSCVGNLFESLRLYDEMKKKNWVPSVDVYHSLIFVLTRENCLNEALKIVNRMKEMGLQPDSKTYNFIIRPLCEAGKFEEARTILANMVGDGISPTIDTYHALLEGESLEGKIGVLNHMRKVGLGPNKVTFLLIIGKFFKLNEPGNALKIWSEMKQYLVKPDHRLYAIFVEGLVKCGLIVKAREFYSEMIYVGNVEDPFLKKLLEEPVQEATKGKGSMNIVSHVKNCKSSIARTRRRRQQREKKKTSGT